MIVDAPQARRRGTRYRSPDGSHWIVRVSLPGGTKSSPIHLPPDVDAEQADRVLATLADKAAKGELVKVGSPDAAPVVTLGEIEDHGSLVSKIVHNKHVVRSVPGVPAVYLFACGSLIKIGMTGSLRARAQHYFSHNPVAKLVAAQPCSSAETARSVEHAWHGEARQLIREHEELDLDEWFLLTDPIATWVNEKARQWGSWWLQGGLEIDAMVRRHVLGET